MQARVTVRSASVGSTIRASGTVSTRTSRAPYMTVARMLTLPLVQALHPRMQPSSIHRCPAKQPALSPSQALHGAIEDSIDVGVRQRGGCHLQTVVDRGVQEVDRVFRIEVGSQFSSTNALINHGPRQPASR